MNDSVRSNTAQAQLPARASLGSEDLRLQLECPKCKTPAWVSWSQLPHLLRCPGCRNSFWISKSGHIESEHQCGTTKLQCPRCQQQYAWPSNAPLKHFRCKGCSLDITLDNSDAAAPSAEAQAKERKAARKQQWDTKAYSGKSIAAMVGGVLAVVALLVAGLVWMMSSDQKLIAAANQFTIASAFGDTEKAAEWLSLGQEAAYKRWASVSFGGRSQGGSERLEVEVREYSSSQAIVAAQLGHNRQDRLVLLQVWRRSPDGAWQFDPTASLEQEATPGQ